MFRAQTAQNVAIVVGLQWFNRLLALVTKVVLVRLLVPDDFGVFALATGVIGFVGTFGNFGLDYAIVQKGERATEEDYDVAMSLRLVISVGLFLGSLAVAGPWASLFQEPTVAPATEILALGYLVLPWSFVPGTHLTADLRYRATAVPNLAGQLVNAVVSIALAVLGFGLWALVWGLLLGQAVTVAVFSAVRPWRFRFSLRRGVATPLLKFAQHIAAATILAFLITNIDNFVVGLSLGSTQLGYYAVAYGIGTIPVFFLSGPAGSALFPSLARLQGQPDVLRRGYLEGYGYAVAVIAPMCVGMAVLAPEIVSIVLGGPTWAPAAVPLFVLAVYGLPRSLIDFGGSLFGAVGRPRIVAELNLYILIGSLVLLVPLTLAWGLVGTAVAMTIPVAAVAVASVVRSAQILKGTPREFFARLWAPLFAAGAMGVAVAELRAFVYPLLPPRVDLLFLNLHEATTFLLIAMPVGVLLYFVMLRLLARGTFDGVVHHALLVIGRRKGAAPPGGPMD